MGSPNPNQVYSLNGNGVKKIPVFSWMGGGARKIQF